jgi:ferredoxin-NADP reductase/Na+-translocating ferredoxin:NAD+ oxidoreductase RnfD subunit
MTQIFRAGWHYLEAKLDGVAMYRTVTLSLIFLFLHGLVLSLLGRIPYSIGEQVLSALLAVGTALLLNIALARILKVAANHESAVITALILYFLVLPAELINLKESWIIVAVTALAIVSKYFIAYRGQHIVNPAAFGVFGLALVYAILPLPGYFESTWWIGRPEFFIPLLLAGGAVVMKIRKWTPVLAFLGVAFVMYLFEEWRFRGEWSAVSSEQFWLSGPSLFLAFFMLTEPFTMPPRKPLQAAYGAAVGVISQTTLFLSVGIKMTPELALILGNLLFYPATLKRKLMLPLKSARLVAKGTYEFVFGKPEGLKWLPGQYLEWMLPHGKTDDRGVRRYFTIASSPTEDDIKLAVRFPDMGASTYKQSLLSLKPGEVIIASQLAGDFLLPKETDKKLAFVAGGIGVTPFLSHLAYMRDTETKFDTALYYCNNTESDIAYRSELATLAATLPLKVVHILAKEEVAGLETGFLTAELIKRQTPDYAERYWYLSGPPGMVNAYSKLLRELEVPERQIIRDFFPGLA